MLRYSVTVTVLQFLKSKIPKDSQDMALDHESHWVSSPLLYVKTDTWILFPCHQTWVIYKESKPIILSLEQCKLLRVFDAVSLQCLRLVVKETICFQGRNKVHDKVAYRSMAWVYNLCRILQHIVNGFDNVSLAEHHSVIERHQLVSHVYAQPCHQLYSVTRGFPTPQSGCTTQLSENKTSPYP